MIQIITRYGNLLLLAMGQTLLLALCGLFFACILGMFFGLLSVLKNKACRIISSIFVDVIRGVPMIVLAYFIYFGVPYCLNNMMGFNFTLTALQAGTVCLALNCGAYMAEIIRAGIERVDKGQMEAARSLGLPYWRAMQRVVLPQAIKNILPALANELVTMVKESSICSVLGMTELIWGAKTVATTTYKTLSPYVLAALVYFVINYPAGKAIEAIERRMRRGDRI